MRTAASTFAQGVDLSLYIIAGISIFFLLGITAVMIYFVFRYNKKRNPKSSHIEGNNTIEVVWTAVPTILVMVMFYFGWLGFRPMRTVPDNAMEITAYGQMWKFSFEYPDGLLTDSLVIPIHQPVKLNLQSRDVLHSFFIPAFRIKEDLVPGKNNYMWFEATTEGRYDIMCAEYCGQLHSYMLTSVTVVSQEQYDAWLGKASVKTDIHPGLAIMKQNACFTCHTTDGSKLIGPSLKGIYGKKEVVETNGVEREVTIDDTYIRESIKQPNADVVKGYAKGLMIPYDQVLNDEQISDIIDYMKTL
ncbi:MAG: cytochrome c oxidase subunit II [Bacteroidetes bacterium]|nr:cytochrome c oxidase subunit II [Bacteroidota bacterium]